MNRPEVKWAEGTKPTTDEQSEAIKAIKEHHRDLSVAKALAAIRTGKIFGFYRGTVPAHVVAKRRERNKVARRSRAINRKAAR